MIPCLKTLNLLQTVLFFSALAWFLFNIPDMTGNTVMIVIALLLIWLAEIAIIGKFLFDRQKKAKAEGSKQHELSVYEFIRRLQEEPKGQTEK